MSAADAVRVALCTGALCVWAGQLVTVALCTWACLPWLLSDRGGRS